MSNKIFRCISRTVAYLNSHVGNMTHSVKTLLLIQLDTFISTGKNAKHHVLCHWLNTIGLEIFKGMSINFTPKTEVNICKAVPVSKYGLNII